MTQESHKKVNWNKLWILISNQPNIEGWGWKKNINLKKELEKKPESTWLNLLNPWSESWDRNNLIKNKSKNNLS
jgi:hypothetical protein